MLKKRQRLTVAEFERHFASGRRRHGTYVQLVHSPAPTFHGSVVVGKKVYKTAVARNRLRRQLYAALFDFSRQSPAPGVFMVLVKPAAKSVSAHVVRTELRSLLAQTHPSR